MQLSCPQCRQGILADDVNLEHQLAKCRTCHTVFSFQTQVAPSSPRSKQPAPRPPVQQPARFTVDDYGPTFQVRWRWFTWEVLFLTLFCVFWNGFLVVWFSLGISQGMPWPMILFGLPFVAVGVAMTYYVVASYVNSTIIRLDGAQLIVRHGPIPSPGNLARPATDFRQLYCQEREVRNKNSRRLEYDLHAIMDDGADLPLIKGLRDRNEVLYLEHELEQRLRIKDEPVAGEIER